MLRNVLPGFGVSLIMGIAFSLVPSSRPAIPPELEDFGLDNAHGAKRLDAAGRYGTAGGGTPLGPSFGGEDRDWAPAPTNGEAGFDPGSGGRISAWPTNPETNRPVDLVADSFIPSSASAIPAAHPVSSVYALGSLSPGDYFPGAVHRPELPDKGWRFWSEAGAWREKRKTSPGDGGLHYRQQGRQYRLGADYDLTLNSIVGLSFALEQREVYSLRPDDRRRGELASYTAGLHFDRLFEAGGSPFPADWAGTFVLSGAAFFGRVKSSTSGNIVLRGGNQSPFLCDWREEDSHSTVYGFSGKLSHPLPIGDEWTFFPELGLDYTRVKTPAHGFAVISGAQTVVGDGILPASAPTSLLIPAIFRARRDYRKSWGLASPSLKTGLIAELGRSPGGVAAYNASAAQALTSEAGLIAGLPTGLTKGAPGRFSFLLGLSLELLMLNGWEARLDYSRKWNREFHVDDFRLEAGKCF